VVFGLIGEVNIGMLLIGGVIPGLLVTATIMATVWLLVWQDPTRAPTQPRVPLREKLVLLRVVGPMLLLFGMVTGVIYTGVATPTEASGLGAFGALALAAYRGKLKGPGFRRALVNAAQTSCMIAMILLGAHIFGYFLTLTHLTQDLVQWVGALPLSRWIIITLILAGYIVLGSFMDQIAILVLTVPVVLPLIKSLGFDPVWFGVIKIVTAEVGMITPPIGLNCFVVSRYSGTPVAEVFHGSMPHFLAHLLAIALMVAIPDIILWLPNRMAP
jgi:tripartite ATP-independent transporter DctM subunit